MDGGAELVGQLALRLVLLRSDAQHALRIGPQAGQLLELHFAVERGSRNAAPLRIEDVSLELARVGENDARRVHLGPVNHQLNLRHRSAIEVDAQRGEQLKEEEGRLESELKASEHRSNTYLHQRQIRVTLDGVKRRHTRQFAPPQRRPFKHFAEVAGHQVRLSRGVCAGAEKSVKTVSVRLDFGCVLRLDAQARFLDIDAGGGALDQANRGHPRQQFARTRHLWVGSVWKAAKLRIRGRRNTATREKDREGQVLTKNPTLARFV